MNSKLSDAAKKVLQGTYELSLNELRFIKGSLQTLISHLESENAAEPGEDQFDNEFLEIAQVESILKDEKMHLKGPKAALLAAFALSVENGGDPFLGRQITLRLRRFNRHVSNISTTMDSLVDSKFVRLEPDSLPHARTYRLTHEGFEEARDILADY